jgi:hypothetical protein
MTAPRSWLRKWARRCARLAVRILPRECAPWAQAMCAELEHIERDDQALVWALGCVIAGAKERLAMNIFIESLLWALPATLAVDSSALLIYWIKDLWHAHDAPYRRLPMLPAMLIVFPLLFFGDLATLTLVRLVRTLLTRACKGFDVHR